MKVYLISDLHLGHRNIIRGGRIGIRPFDTLDAMHERIIDGWNSVVKPHDKIYMLGDLTLERPKRNEVGHFWDWLMAICARLEGRKRLLLGNHDHLSPSMYQLLGFEKVLAYQKLADCIVSHIPVHPSQFMRFVGNIHGHTHDKHVLATVPSALVSCGEFAPVYDRRYLNVSVESLNYVPISLDDAVATLRRRS